MNTLIGTLFSTILGVLVLIVRQYLEKKGGSALIRVIEIVAENSVKAVEQISKDTDIKGRQKMEMAKEFARKSLSDRKIYISEEELNMMLEAQVLAIQKAWQEGVSNGAS